MKRRYGFTLAEMMVSVAVLGLVSIYLTDMLIRQNKTYQVVDAVTEVQQNLRAIADLIERDTRITGFMVPEAAAVCGLDNRNGADVLFVTDSDAINPTNQNQLGLGVQLNPGGTGYTGNGVDVLNLTGTNPTTVDGVPFYDNDNNGVADDDFLSNAGLGQQGGVIVVDRANPSRGASCGIVTNVGANSLTVDFNVTVGGAVPTALIPGGTTLGAVPVGGSAPDLVAVPAHWYGIVPPAASGSPSPQLWRDGLPLADDVEDLQMALFYDLDGDGLVTGDIAAAQQPPISDQEYPGSNPAAGGVAYVAAGGPWDNTFLREIRVNFVVRTTNQDPDVAANPGIAQGQFVTTENRAAPGGPADGFRRRVHQMTVRPRNVGLRPPEV